MRGGGIDEHGQQNRQGLEKRDGGGKRGNQELRVWLGYIGKKAGRREVKLRA